MRSKAGKLAKQRLDELLVERGLVETRTKAQSLILAGKVRVGEGDGARRDLKPGDRIDADSTITLDEPDPYVGRGGHKLAAALDAFGIDPAGKGGVGWGGSPGGFPRPPLGRGAR